VTAPVRRWRDAAGGLAAKAKRPDGQETRTSRDVRGESHLLQEGERVLERLKGYPPGRTGSEDQP
jgi:hypothetical protein